MIDDTDVIFTVDVARYVARSQEAKVAHLLAALEQILRPDNIDDPKDIARKAIRTLHTVTGESTDA